MTPSLTFGEDAYAVGDTLRFRMASDPWRRGVILRVGRAANGGESESEGGESESGKDAHDDGSSRLLQPRSVVRCRGYVSHLSGCKRTPADFS